MNPACAAWFDARAALHAAWSLGPELCSVETLAKYRDQMITYERKIRRAAYPTGFTTGPGGDPSCQRWVEWDAWAAAVGVTP